MNTTSFDTDNTDSAAASPDVPSISATTAFDLAGNMTTVPSDPAAAQTPYNTTYDAWHRLVRVRGGPDNIDIAYEYDGINRRTRQLVTSGTAPSLDFYYNSDWKIIEERIIDFTPATNSPATQSSSVSAVHGTTNTPAADTSVATPAPAHSAPPVTNKVRAQYIYGVRDRNDLIFRDYSADGIAPPARHYVLTDAMFSTTAIANTTGEIQQRLRYTAFGTVAYMNADFTDTHSNPTAWQIFLHGEYYDIDTQWSNYGFRYYIPVFGRWVNRDPLNEILHPEGKPFLMTEITSNWENNLYAMVSNDTVNKIDFLGLAQTPLDKDEMLQCLKDLQRALELVRKAIKTKKCQCVFCGTTCAGRLEEILNKTIIAIDNSGELDAHGYTYPKDGQWKIWITPLGCRLGRWNLAATIIHEIMHECDNYAGGEDSAIKAEKECGLSKGIPVVGTPKNPRK